MSEEDKERLRSYTKSRAFGKQETSGNGLIISKIKEMGPKKVSIMLYKEQKKDGIITVIRDVPEDTVRAWIKRGNVPIEYHEAILSL